MGGGQLFCDTMWQMGEGEVVDSAISHQGVPFMDFLLIKKHLNNELELKLKSTWAYIYANPSISSCLKLVFNLYFQ